MHLLCCLSRDEAIIGFLVSQPPQMCVLNGVHDESRLARNMRLMDLGDGLVVFGRSFIGSGGMGERGGGIARSSDKLRQ